MALTNLNGQVAWTQQAVNTAQNGRFHIGSLFPSATATTGLTTWRDGVVVTTNQGGSNNIPNDGQIKASGSPSLTLTCEAAHFIITRAGQGPFLCVLNTQGSLTLAAADPTNPRIDRIVAQIYDGTPGLGDTMPTTPALAQPGGVVIRAVTGTPAGSPTAPAQPAGSITLATVSVVANDTTINNSDITDLRRSAITVAGARTQLPGDIAVTDNGAVSGELRHTISASYPDVRVWSGTNWKPLSTPVYTTTGNRNTDLGSGAQYSGQMAVVDSGLTANYAGTWYNTLLLPGAPALRVRASAAQSIPDNAFTTLAFDTEDTTDIYVNHDNVTNNSRWTATQPGIYMFAGTIPFTTNASGSRGSRWLKNGVEIAGSQLMTLNGGAALSSINAAATIFITLAGNDYIELQAYQNSGGALVTLATASAHATMCGVYLRN